MDSRSMPSAGATRRAPVRMLLLLLVLACLVPGVLGIGALMYRLYQDDRAQTESHAVLTARTLAKSLDAELEKATSFAAALATTIDPVNPDLPAFHARARTLLAAARIGSRVALTDAQGRHVLNTLRPLGDPLPPLGNADQLKRMEPGVRALLSDVFTAGLTGRPAVSVNIPVATQGRVAYVLSLVLDDKDLAELLRRQDLPVDWITAIVDRSGTTAARSALPERFVGTKSNPLLLDRLSKASEGAFDTTTREGVPSIIAYSRSPRTQWAVALAIPNQTLANPWRRDMMLLAAGMLVLFALGGGLAWRLGGRIDRSVRGLAEAAESMSRGRAAAPAEWHFAEAERAAQAIGHSMQMLANHADTLAASRDELSASKGKLEAALANMVDAVFIADAQGRFVELNEAFLKVHRFANRAECLQSLDAFPDILEVSEPGGPPLPLAQWPGSRALRGEIGTNAVYRLWRKDLGIGWFSSFSFAPIRDTTGAIVGSVVVGRDISEQIEREQALAQANERLGLAQRAAGAGLWTWDLAEDRFEWSDEMHRLFGLDPQRDQATLERWRAALHPEDRERAIAEIQAAVLEQTPFASQYRIVRPDGQVRWIEAFGNTSGDVQGRPLRLSGISLDVTQRKQTEDELSRHREHLEVLVGERTAELAEAKEAAEAASRSKSAFLANMSHEIRTPMNAIIGLTHLMARDTRDTVQRDRLKKVDDAARHLLQVINDILDLSKIEAGKLRLERAEFGRDELLSRAFEMVADAARSKGLELIVDTDHLPERMVGDAKHLAQSLINLLANAVKFTEQGWVRLRGELLAEAGDRLQVRFEVRDTGPGIPKDRQALLFQAFEQADTSTTRRHGGTGLGLALTRHLAALMGGEAGVDSEPGAGSSFWFTAWVGRAAEAGDRATPVPIRGLQALLVDDLPEALVAIGDRLTQLGLEVDTQPGGAAAIARVEERMAAGRPFDVLLIDWRMGPVDGIETLEGIRRIVGAGMPPSILVTAHDETAMWREARAAQFDAVLVKPITASAIHDTLNRILRRERAAQPPAPMPEGEAEATLRRLHGGQRVLLAEDNVINQEVACELLSSVGLEVEVAEDGQRAVQLALSRPYDLVLMDMQMPEMDGVAATEAIRAKAGRRLPIIAMTANAFGEDREACLRAGMNDHVAKPVDPAMLYATLLRWLPLPPTRGGLAAETGGLHAAGPSTDTLLARLGRIEGFDVERAQRNLGGHAHLLGKVLQTFVNSYHPNGAPGLQQGSDPASLGELCHSLRGACATIGAVGLDDRLQAIERALREGASSAAVEQLAQQAQDELQQLARELRAALAP